MKAKDFPQIERSVPLIDIERGGTGGRTVTAYAATFNDAYRVVDQFGDYDEVIDPAAFNRELGRGIAQVSAIFNHGMTLWGTPAERYAMPIGTPLEIKADSRGLLTVTRYAETPLGDEILELIDSGAIKYQSFRGPVYKTAPDTLNGDGRTIKRRLQLGLKEYGPSPFPANAGAEMMAVRSQLLADQVGEMSPDERKELLALLDKKGTHLDPSPVELVDGGQSAHPEHLDPSPVELVDDDTDELILANANRRRRTSLKGTQ